MFVRLSLIFVSGLTRLALSGNICYLPDGSTNNDVPCDADALFTQCCGTRSACLTNGLCILEATNDTGISYARGTCTDRSWASPLCPQQCQLNQDTPTNRSAYDFRTAGVQVWQCGSKGYGEEARYCCESEAEQQRCCSTETAIFTLLGAEVGPSTSAITTSTSLSVSSAATSTSRPTATGFTVSETSTSIPTATSSAVAPNTTDTKAIGIGAGVGGGVGLCILVAVVVFFLRRQRHRNGTPAVAPNASELPVNRGNKQPFEVWTQPQQVWTQPQEMPSQAGLVWELSGDPKTPRRT